MEVTNKTCVYDGMVFFVLDPSIIDHIRQNADRYQLQPSCAFSTAELEGFTGQWKNFTFILTYNSRRVGVKFKGSFHTLSNGDHNHNKFCWNDFLTLIFEFIEEFQFDPQLADVWSLEAGLNNVINDGVDFDICNIIDNILFLKGKPRIALRQTYPGKACSMKWTRGTSYYKIYDKGKHFKQSKQILRTECGCTTRGLAKFGIKTLSDLISVNNHNKYAQHFIKCFETLLIYQPEGLNHTALSKEDKSFIQSYNSANSWSLLRAESNYQFKKAAYRWNSVMDKYTPVNIKTYILDIMKAQL